MIRFGQRGELTSYKAWVRKGLRDRKAPKPSANTVQYSPLLGRVRERARSSLISKKAFAYELNARVAFGKANGGNTRDERGSAPGEPATGAIITVSFLWFCRARPDLLTHIQPTVARTPCFRIKDTTPRMRLYRLES